MEAGLPILLWVVTEYDMQPVSPWGHMGIMHVWEHMWPHCHVHHCHVWQVPMPLHVSIGTWYVWEQMFPCRRIVVLGQDMCGSRHICSPHMAVLGPLLMP